MEITDGFIPIQDKSASDEIREDLLVFSEDVLRTKFPNLIDGTKDIVRRILWFNKDHKEMRSLTRVIGDVSEYHVAGDSSIYGASIRLGQAFMVGNPLVSIRGRSGEYYDPGDAADQRYLEASISDFARDVYFTNVHLKTIPMVPTKNFGSMEPRYLIPRLPMALVLGNLTVGFGFKSYIPMLGLEDVCDLVMIFSQFYQNGNIGIPDYKKVAKYLVPTFPIRNLIKNRAELINAYKQGIFDQPIKLEGWADFTGNAIILRTVPYGTDFGTITRAIRGQLTDRKSWLWDYLVTVNKFNSDVAELSIEIKRGQNPFDVFEKIKGILRFDSNWRPIFNYMKDGRCVNLNPLSLIYLWYRERVISIAGGLKYQQTDLVLKKMMLEAMLIISEHSDQVINLIKNSENEEEAINALYTTFTQLTRKQAEIIAHQRISVLAKANRKQIESDLEQVEVDINNTVQNFGRINEIIYSDAQYLKKKYAKPKITQFADEFIGYVQFGSWGIIQFTNEAELYQILSTKGWPSSLEKSIHVYENIKNTKYIIKNNRLIELTDNSKEIFCEGLVCFNNTDNQYTLAVNNNDNSTCVVNKVVMVLKEGMSIWPVNYDFYTIRRNGQVTEENISNFTNRKTVSSGSKTNVIYAMSKKLKDAVVFHMNTSDPNILRIDRILTENNLGNLTAVPQGDMYILGIYPINTKNDFYLNIPQSCIKNMAMEYIRVKNIKNLFTENKNNFRMSLTKSTEFSKLFKRDKTIRTLYVMDLS